MSPGPSGLMRASEQSVVRRAHSLRCESATWVAAHPAVPEAVTRARHSQQCWVSCPELPGPSGLMRASERSRRRQLMQPRVERLNVVLVLSTWESSRRGGGRVAVRLESTSCWWTYQRHCGMLGPEILVDVPAALCERWAQRFDTRAGTSAGRPTRRLAGAVPKNGHQVRYPRSYFLTRLVPPSRSQRSSTLCRRGWYFVQRGSIWSSPYLLYSPPFLPSSSLFLWSLTAAHRFGRIFHFGIFGPITRRRQDESGTPSTLRPRLPWAMARRVDARRR